MRSSLYISLFSFWAICVFTGLFPARTLVHAQQIRFKTFDTESGLSHYSVRSLLYDHLGFLWIGTPAGLNRYDGYSFKVYDSSFSDSTGLSGNQIDALHEGPDGTLWIGTNTGHVDRFVREKNCFISYRLIPEEIGNTQSTNVEIKSITHDFGGNIWVGTSAGLFRLPNMSATDGEAEEAITFEQINSEAINDLLIDQDGLLWLATDSSELGAINPSSELLQQPEYPMDILLENMPSPISRLFQLRNRNFIWGTETGEVYSMDMDAKENVEVLLQNERNGAIKSIFEDSSGDLWIGTSQNGLHYLNSTSGASAVFLPDPSTSYAIGHHSIEKIAEDRFGNLWIGTWQGLNRITQRDFNFFTTFSTNEIFPSLSRSSRISSIQEINDNELLLGTDGGSLFRFFPADNSTSRFRVAPERLNSSRISSIAHDAQHIWIGYFGDGFLRHDRQTSTSQLFQRNSGEENALSDDNVISMLSDRKNRLWIGTFEGGINRYDIQTDSFSHYVNDPADSSSISSNTVMALFEDSSGSIWIGTVRGGLNRFDEETNGFIRYALESDSLLNSGSSTIFTIHQTRPGYLWIGLEEGGLVELNTIDRSFIRYDMRDGLPNNSVLSIESYGNQLWLGTDNGLSKFELETKRFTNYTREDGLQGNSFHVNASASTQSGNLYFGGIDGFTYFDPENISVTDEEAPVVLVGFDVNNEPAKLDTSVTMVKQIELDYEKNSFRFTFAALDFTDPDRLQYRYKLENYDDKWIQRSDESKRFANYTKVKPNDYVLHVEATNSAGMWSKKGLSIPITINPPFWQTWWFQTAVVLFVIGLVYSGHQYRLTKQQQIHDTRVQGMQDMENLRMRIAGQLHDRVSANLSTIGLLAESLSFQKNAGEKEKERFDKITNLARDSANSIRETSWVVNTGFDKLDKLISAMEDVGEDMISVIAAFNFDVLNPIPDTPITMDFRQNVYYFFREALHNIIRHAEASHVMVTVSTAAGKHFELEIKDDGKGFLLSEVHESNGMVLFQRRARNLKGTVSIKSDPGNGTCIRLNVPIEMPPLSHSA